MTNNKYIHTIALIEKKLLAPKWQRVFVLAPNYLKFILLKLYTTWFKKSIQVQARTFWQQNLLLSVPASFDIYIAGLKTHGSEIRLAKYLCHQAPNINCYVDIGAHIGFFANLVKHINAACAVHAIEPTPSTYNLLAYNTTGTGINIYNQAIAAQNQTLAFYTFPPKYAEYNSIQIEQYKNEAWFKQNTPTVQQVVCATATHFFKENNIQAAIIKIDVEGAEDKVLQGMASYLQSHKPIIIMEYLGKNNTPHKAAEQILLGLGYTAHCITAQGGLQAIPTNGTHLYLAQHGIDSDNVVYCFNASL
jgi:FkbM family methyltransferase